MTHNLRSQSGRDKNLILVSNNSDLFGDNNSLGMLMSRNSSCNPGEYRRNSSVNNNLFQNFNQQHKPKEQQKTEHLTDAQRYAQECLEYEKYEFDDKIRLIIHRMAILAYHGFKDKLEHPFMTFFVQRFLCTLSKKLLLNRFELLFLEYVFEESKWRYEQEAISQCVDEFKPLMHIPESENPHGMVRNLQVYLLFCAYYSKRSLNDIHNEGIYNYFLKSISPRFKERYQQWVDSSGILKIKINPKILNSIFRKVNSFQEREKDVIENYNLLVQEILEISPAYNADKENKGKRKKKKTQEEFKHEEKDEIQQDSLSRNREIQQLNPVPPEEYSQEEYPSLVIRKKPTSYAENLNGLDPLDYIKRNMN